MILHAVVEDIFFEDEIQLLFMLTHSLVTMSCVLATLRQVHVPGITGFAENVVPENLRCHFRISIQMFEEILHILSPTLLPKHAGWSGGAMVQDKLPVSGRPTIWIKVGQGSTALAVGAGGGCLELFTLI